MSSESQTTKPKLTLHWLNRSRAHRIVWLLEELGVEYDLVEYKRGADMRAPKELTALSPLGKAPVLEVEIPGQPKMMLAESGAIMEVLLDLFDKEHKFSYASDSNATLEQKYNYHYFMHMAEGTAMPPLLIAIIARALPKNTPLLIRPIVNGISGALNSRMVQPDVTKMLHVFQDNLSKTPYFAGDKFTTADIMMHYPVDCMNMTPGLKDYPKVAEWRERVYARDAWKKTIEKVGELDLGGFR
ncbi:glutathione S-transferase-like protein [Atractiella rhizophila]|nr:glutathione S-transferase-like protein [Atractiella rhizophila]